MGRKKLDVDIDSIVKNVITLIENGCTISEALESLDVRSSWFYKNITTAQKMEIQLSKTTNTKYGIGHWLYRKC